MTRLTRLIGITVVVALTAVLYFGYLHPWLMTWGTTAEEREQVFPGDSLVPDAVVQDTRGITIDASADAVWSWLVQLGQDRAGFYSYDWLENLTGVDIHNADDIHPEWQSRAAGDGILMAPTNYLGGRLGDFTVQGIVAVEPQRAILVRGLPYLVRPIDDHTTRLLVRDRSGTPPNLITVLLWDPTHFVMQRQMLRGIRDRAEGHPHPPLALTVFARIGWALMGVFVLGVFLARKRRMIWLSLPVLAAFPALAFGHDADAALAGFLAIGITILGILMLGRQWLLPYMGIAVVVLLTLLFAPDAYLAFGFIFVAVCVVGLVALRRSHSNPSASGWRGGRHRDSDLNTAAT